MSEQQFEEMEEAEIRPFNLQHFLRILSYLRPYPRAVALTGLGILLASGVTLFEPYLLGRVVDVGIVGRDLPAAQQIVAVMVGLRILDWLGKMLRIRSINVVGQGVLFDLRQGLFDHLQNLGLRFYDRHPVGRIMSRITSDVNAIATMINNGLVTVVSEGIGLLGILSVMIWMSWRLTLIAFVTTPILIFILYKVRTSLQTSWKNVRKSVSNISTYLNESVNGIEVTQAFGRQNENIAVFDGLTKASHQAWMRAVKTDEAIWPSVEFVGVIGTSLVVTIGSWMVLRHELTVGFVMAFVSYLWLFWQPLSAMSKVYGLVLSAMASAERIFDFLDTAPEITDRPYARPMPPIQGAVRFDHVNFRYRPDQPLILTDIHFEVEPGQTVALVGHTGSGKTTIINLLLRFYDPVDGRILIDGHDLREMQLQTLRRQMAVVLQDGFVFSGSLADNIRYGRLEATEEEIQAVARAVHLDAFVQTLEGGYGYEVGERGNRLSVGQRQLIAFARALLADPRILILDEATSNVDTETEQIIQEAMRTLLQGRTAFIIAHRLSTIRDADLILVVDQGQIVELGSHDELLHRGGRYFDLYLRQFSGGLEHEVEGGIVDGSLFVTESL